MEHKFFKCMHCGNIVATVKNKGVPLFCCGEKMTELLPNTVEASTEKHIPVLEKEGNVLTVKVGSAIHPTTEAHYIEWLALETENGITIKHLLPTDKPEASFSLLDGEEVVAVYSYCNLHGLWVAK